MKLYVIQQGNMCSTQTILRNEVNVNFMMFVRFRYFFFLNTTFRKRYVNCFKFN